MAGWGRGAFGQARVRPLTKTDELHPTGKHLKPSTLTSHWFSETSPASVNLCFLSEQAVLSRDTVEQVLVGQRRWRDSVVGEVCSGRCIDQDLHRRQTQSLLRGIVKARSRRAKGKIRAAPYALRDERPRPQFQKHYDIVENMNKIRMSLFSENLVNTIYSRHHC